jgi:hypothetical protein
MPGFMPGIHAVPFLKIFNAGRGGTAWMAGTSQDKPGHDDL